MDPRLGFAQEVRYHSWRTSEGDDRPSGAEVIEHFSGVDSCFLRIIPSRQQQELRFSLRLQSDTPRHVAMTGDYVLQPVTLDQGEQPRVPRAIEVELYCGARQKALSEQICDHRQ